MRQNLHLLKIQRAYSKMSIPAQFLIDENVKRLRTIPNVGENTALEILAAVGMLLAMEEEAKLVQPPGLSQ